MIIMFGDKAILIKENFMDDDVITEEELDLLESEADAAECAAVDGFQQDEA